MMATNLRWRHYPAMPWESEKTNSRVMMPDIARELRRIMGILWEYGEISRRIVVRQIARTIQRSCEILIMYEPHTLFFWMDVPQAQLVEVIQHQLKFYLAQIPTVHLTIDLQNLKF